jgi:hypothetical protein
LFSNNVNTSYLINIVHLLELRNCSGNNVNTSYLINIVNLLELHNCSGNNVNTSYLINIVNLLELHHCSLMYKMHGKTHIKIHLTYLPKLCLNPAVYTAAVTQRFF